ncbi:ATP-dependent nuclease [Reyranella soli]|uniref:ATP-dependent nuclease n=1 Tax=Reyranella soli TaxID=1230389 RepID=UPI0011BE2320|nr:AAA family ATPase [Reyranella soli]
MKIARLTIQNFRGIRYASLLLPDHGVLIGDNNTGKSSVLEAIDLALGPDRLSRRPPVDEHDFYQGKYLPGEAVELTLPPGTQLPPGIPLVAEGEIDPAPDEDTEKKPTIEAEVLITDLNEEQIGHFGNYIEWWDKATDALYQTGKPAGIDAATIFPALRVTFVGEYDTEDDDFTGETFYTRSRMEGTPEPFRKRDKQLCGFLYLRSIRTGSRALSLEHGSLLDIILRLKELRPRIWEDTISHLEQYNVAGDPALGISGVLESVSKALKKYVPKEWGLDPHLKVSTLTREHLRKVITAFIATGDGDHAAPFYRQGTGTINMLVLALLSQIAEGKQNVVFAMEEPETAIPPYAQKCIVHEVRKLSAQALFTSHSPYVLEEFDLNETIILHRDKEGILGQTKITLPDSVKHKRYRQEFRTRFCEGLLSRRILLAEGATENTSMPAVARRLAELKPNVYKSLEALGICTIDAGSDSMIGPLADLYGALGKTVFGLCDKQTPASEAAIEAKVHTLFMHSEHGFEDLVLNNTKRTALERFSDALEWPDHLKAKYPTPKTDVVAALRAYFAWSKGNWGIADFLTQCSEDEVPQWIKDTCLKLNELCDPTPTPTEPLAAAVGAATARASVFD